MAKSFNDSYLTSGEGKNTYIRRIWPDLNDQLAHNAYQLALKVLEQPRRVAKLVDDESKWIMVSLITDGNVEHL